MSELLLLLPIVCPLTYFERERHFCFVIKYFTLIARVIDVTSESDYRFCHLRGSSLPLRRLREISVCWHYVSVAIAEGQVNIFTHHNNKNNKQQNFSQDERLLEHKNLQQCVGVSVNKDGYSRSVSLV